MFKKTIETFALYTAAMAGTIVGTYAGFMVMSKIIEKNYENKKATK